MSNTTSNSHTSGSLTDVGPGRWTLDPAGTSVHIQNKTLGGLINVKGTFTKVSGEGEALAGGGAHGSITIDATSVDTKNTKRDVHLRSADFFDVDKHPSFVFTATDVTPVGDGTAQITGELTVLGKSSAVSFTAEASEISPDAVTLTAEVPVDRREFGMAVKQALVIRPVTLVTLTARFVRQSS
ncbi:YceI family protein [Streptomyces sp. NPDC087263]|uniref:YceI family protein n=1 Tax=Streptomyces sp. NPDC087263 TaxID=3365773 RepID=UPI003808E88B